MGTWIERILRRKPDPAVESAKRAAEEAAAVHEQVVRQWPQIRALTRDLHAMREENNFAARLRAAYGEGR